MKKRKKKSLPPLPLTKRDKLMMQAGLSYVRAIIEEAEASLTTKVAARMFGASL